MSRYPFTIDQETIQIKNNLHPGWVSSFFCMRGSQ
jgi:hypothetical protein